MQFKERLYQQDATISKMLPLELLEPTWTTSTAQIRRFVGKLSDAQFTALFRSAPIGCGDERYKALLASRKGWLIEAVVQIPVKPRAAFEAGILYSFDECNTVRTLAYGNTYEEAMDMLILQASFLRTNSRVRKGLPFITRGNRRASSSSSARGRNPLPRSPLRAHGLPRAHVQ
jgi:hypothetical protein